MKVKAKIFLSISLVLMTACFFLTGSVWSASKDVKGVSKEKQITVQKKTLNVKAALGPDLVVERIWLDNQCRVNFTLKNQGNGGIGTSAFNSSKLILFLGSNRVEYMLKSPLQGRPPVDPGCRLKSPGGKVDFNTGEQLASRRLVRVWVDSNDRINETNNANNTGRESLLPNCRSVAGSGLQTGLSSNAHSSSMVARLPGPEVDISALRLTLRPTHTMVSMGTGSGSSRDAYTVDALQPFYLSYRITGKDAMTVTTELRAHRPGTTGTGVIVGSTDNRQNTGDNFSVIGSTEEVTASTDMGYTLTVRAMKPGTLTSTVQKKITVNVNKPQIALETPEVNEQDMTVTLFAVNRSRIDYPGSGATISGDVRIVNWNGSRTFASIPIRLLHQPIPAGGRLELIRIPLLDYDTREHYYAARQIQIQAEAEDLRHYFTESGGSVSETHYWSTETTNISADLLIGFFGALSGEVRLNNYRDPGRNSTRTRPGISRDSWVEIGGEDPEIFTPPFLSAKITGSVSGKTRYDYRPFINDFSADLGGRGAISIPRRNVIQLHVSFETSGGNEIKGYEYDDGRFVDDDAPDIDVRTLDLDINFYLNLRRGKLIISHITVQPTLDMRITDRFSWILNKLLPLFEDYIQSELSSYIRDALDIDNLSDQLNEEIDTALGIMNVQHINSFELTPAGLRIDYVPAR